MRPIEITRSIDQMAPMGASATRLEPMLIRLPPELAARVRRIARATRIRQSDLLREAVYDLVMKHGENGARSDVASSL
jgi:hypothetical protein